MDSWMVKTKFSITKFDIPNALTIMRLLLTPIFAMIFYFNTDFTKILSGIIFATAGFTDFLDGYLARSWGAQSILGKILDPIADKLIVIVAIVMLMYFHKINGISIFFALTIIMREIIISGIREALSEVKLELPVSFLGKVKTAIQMLSILVLILSDVEIFAKNFTNFHYFREFGIFLFWISSILSIHSGYQYISKSIGYIKGK